MPIDARLKRVVIIGTSCSGKTTLALLSRDSVLWWVIKTYRRRQREYPRLFKEPAYRHLQIIAVYSPAEAERFLQSIN